MVANTFLTENFLLKTKAAQRLYFDYAEKAPIIDYHCHLPPDQIASNHTFGNATEIWLKGDHYKWRAMRALGVGEEYITGLASYADKFRAWAQTVPYTWRNPLYHWTHMELQRPFGIRELLNEGNSESVYKSLNEQLQHPDFSTQGLLQQFDVKVVCTTDDPCDDLIHHIALKDNLEVKVLPTFRPDKAFVLSSAHDTNLYVQKLEAAAGKSISTFSDYVDALTQRAEFFAENGCLLSDHGFERMFDASPNPSKAFEIFMFILKDEEVSHPEKEVFNTTLAHELGKVYHRLGWAMQLHLGAIRNNNTRMQQLLGADSGFDSIGDFSQARALAQFLNGLDKVDKLPKTILYNLNPADNELFATMIGNFNDGSVKGKIQYGSAWWFLDQHEGMEKQINALSNMGLLSCFVGMLTDSRSFLSYSRHEYFRRILCNLLGQDMEDGLLPLDFEWAGKIVRDICFNNANQYFNLRLPAYR